MEFAERERNVKQENNSLVQRRKKGPSFGERGEWGFSCYMNIRNHDDDDGDDDDG